ncbi:DoxX family protein [Flavobacteriaceae sp. LMIT009]
MTPELTIILKILISLSILNVWLIRFNRSSIWRGGNSLDMKGEFEVYGLPNWSVTLVGFLKVGSAIALIGSIWYEFLEKPSIYMIAVLMIGAIFMHVKVGDPFLKSIPASILFIISCLLISI